jgi:hypothetical protein
MDRSPFSFPDSRSRLADSQWQEIARLSHLPAEARPLIESEIEFYRVRKTAISITPEATGENLRALVRDIDDVRARLEKLTADPRAAVVIGLACEFPTGFAAAMDANVPAHAIRSATHSLETTAQLLAAAEKRIAPSKPGLRQRAVNIAFLVQRLDGILRELTGTGISRSAKRTNSSGDFVTCVCRIADPTISVSSIDEAMKKVIAAQQN